MNIFVAMLQALLGRKKLQEQKPDFSDRMAKYDSASRSRVGKSQGAPSQRVSESPSQSADIMSNPMHPLNPLSPISVYNNYTPSESTRSDCGDYGSSSSSSSYDSGSSSCDSGSSSSSSD